MRVMMGARALAARLVSHCAHIVAKRSSLVVVALCTIAALPMAAAPAHFLWKVTGPRGGTMFLAGSLHLLTSEQLKASAAAMSDPAARSRALGAAGVILARHAQFPASASRELLKLAGEAVSTIRDPQQRAIAQSDWSVAMGQLLVKEAVQGARVAVWSRTQGVAAEMEALLKKAPDEWSQARLLALDHQLRLKLAENDKAVRSLEMALELVGKNAVLAERIENLRTIMQLAGTSAHERINAQISALLPEAEAKAGMEKAQALSHAALIYADIGARAKADQLAQTAQRTPGLSAPESVSISAEVIVRKDLAAAKIAHGGGLYAEAEQILQRLAAYLL